MEQTNITEQTQEQKQTVPKQETMSASDLYMRALRRGEAAIKEMPQNNRAFNTLLAAYDDSQQVLARLALLTAFLDCRHQQMTAIIENGLMTNRKEGEPLSSDEQAFEQFVASGKKVYAQFASERQFAANYARAEHDKVLTENGVDPTDKDAVAAFFERNVRIMAGEEVPANPNN